MLIVPALFWLACSSIAVITAKSTVLTKLTSYGKLSVYSSSTSWWHSGRFYLPSLQCFRAYYWCALGFVTIAFRTIPASEMHFCTLLSLVLLTVHVSIRLYECYFVHRTSKSARQHIGVTLFGVAHYAFVVLSLLSSTSSVITLERSMLKLLHFDTFVSDSMLVAPKWDVHVDVFLSIISVLLFAVGRFHQSVCHNILASLRSHSGSDAYFIPFGDWFSVSASPHYTAELLIYLALCILQPTNVCCWLLLGWVVCNLTITAARTNAWYVEKFGDDYSRLHRYVIIPFVY